MSDGMARLFGVLSDPVRLEILSALARKGCCVSVLQLAVGRSQPNISQHLRVLRQAGLVETRREGRKICYSIAKPGVIKMLSLAKSASG
ncbi:MAG: metalloregulator ArsR/SmtB family transcription factor [Candidatus Micrarchaeia archaeon]|jgi:ArsR family transcriptional regulator